MRQIKFRGRDIETGKYVYGDFINGANGVLINEHKFALPARYVEPDSVQQLIGYDKNGAEVYEGDLVEDLEYNCLLLPTEATFHHYTKILDGEIVKVEEAVES